MWLTIRQAAQQANVSPSTIRRRIQEGKLRIARTAGDRGHYRVASDSLDELFASVEKKAVAVLRSFGL